MPQHKSAIKRARQNVKLREANRQKRSKMRTLIKNVYNTEDAAQAQEACKLAISYIDRMVGKNLLHKNNAAHKKARLTIHVNSLS
jgi:small subunit ribosomal protein S20